MGAMQGMNFTQIYHRIADVLWDTQVAQWSFVSSFSVQNAILTIVLYHT